MPGGHDLCGHTTYIGQVVFSGNAGLLPATIYKGRTGGVAAARGKKFESNTAKVSTRLLFVICTVTNLSNFIEIFHLNFKIEFRT